MLMDTLTMTYRLGLTSNFKQYNNILLILVHIFVSNIFDTHLGYVVNNHKHFLMNFNRNSFVDRNSSAQSDNNNI